MQKIPGPYVRSGLNERSYTSNFLLGYCTVRDTSNDCCVQGR